MAEAKTDSKTRYYLIHTGLTDVATGPGRNMSGMAGIAGYAAPSIIKESTNKAELESLKVAIEDHGHGFLTDRLFIHEFKE